MSQELKIILNDKAIRILNTHLIVKELGNSSGLGEEFVRKVLTAIEKGKKEITFSQYTVV